MELILASNSPRRKELLSKYNIKYKVVVSQVDEQLDSTLSVVENVEMLAYQKAYAVSTQYPDAKVLAADTIVVIDNVILGKPVDFEDAFKMLKTLSGKTHEVITAVAILFKGEKKINHCISKVTFKQLSDSEIIEYINTNEPMDKAGSYAIQGIGAKLISNYEGELDNIIGLPMKLVIDMLK